MRVLRWCPDCPPAREARALLIDEQFLEHVAAVALPFGITALVIHWALGRVDRRAP